jgi:hypothetical protein
MAKTIYARFGMNDKNLSWHINLRNYTDRDLPIKDIERIPAKNKSHF